MCDIILASGSPRRRELMEAAGIDFRVCVSDVDEDIGISDPVTYVQSLSEIKARAVAVSNPDSIVIGADTIVVTDGEILGKPADKEDALAILRRLSGRTHTVYTGVTIIADGQIDTFYESTEVEMYESTDGQLLEYIATGEPMDKAGAYGIQGRGMLLIRRINGDYYNVMGLPIARVYRHLQRITS